MDGWNSIANEIGDKNIPYVKLDAAQSLSMENRFTDFYKIAPGHPSLIRSFGDSIGKEPLPDQINDLNAFWKDDLKLFYRWLEDEHNQYSLYRSDIYNEYVKPKVASHFLESFPKGKQSEILKRRLRLRVPLKLMTDLAYNANAPATINIKSFVPPDMPDPVSLPMHLFQAIQFADPTLEKHQEAVRQTYKELIQRRLDAKEKFFYDSQKYEQLPDIGSFTLSDCVTVMEWPEWQAFKASQNAALRFQNAEDLEDLMRDYWETIKTLHNKLESEAKQRQHWRIATKGTIKLSIAVTAHVMGHALLPDLMHSVPWWKTVAAATAIAQPLHAGLDIIIHGVAKQGRVLLPEIGFKDGGMREFSISKEMQEKLHELKIVEDSLSTEEKREDAIVADASNRIAAEG